MSFAVITITTDTTDFSTAVKLDLPEDQGVVGSSLTGVLCASFDVWSATAGKTGAIALALIDNSQPAATRMIRYVEGSITQSSTLRRRGLDNSSGDYLYEVAFKDGSSLLDLTGSLAKYSIQTTAGESSTGGPCAWYLQLVSDTGTDGYSIVVQPTRGS